jgi:opacity protein-like surface antigen
MHSSRLVAVASGMTGLLLLAPAVSRAALGGTGEPRYQVSALGGIEALNHNNTSIPETFVNIPAAASIAYQLSPMWAVEGELSWMIPRKKTVDLGSAGSEERKTPDAVTYQANLMARLPYARAMFSPYLTAGLGVTRFGASTDADRVPQLSHSESDFAMNFGAGALHGLGSRWAVRADFREVGAFPSKNADGFSKDGKADAIWMERAAVGLGYRF